MSVYFGKTRIDNQTIINGGPKDFTASCRVTKSEKAALQEMAAAEGLNDSDFVRQGLDLRMRFRGDIYYKLVAHAELVRELLADEPMPLIVPR